MQPAAPSSPGACLTTAARAALLQAPYFHDLPHLLAGTDLARHLPYAAAAAPVHITCTINGNTAAHVARSAPAGEAVPATSDLLDAKGVHTAHKLAPPELENAAGAGQRKSEGCVDSLAHASYAPASVASNLTSQSAAAGAGPEAATGTPTSADAATGVAKAEADASAVLLDATAEAPPAATCMPQQYAAELCAGSGALAAGLQLQPRSRGSLQPAGGACTPTATEGERAAASGIGGTHADAAAVPAVEAGTETSAGASLSDSAHSVCHPGIACSSAVPVTAQEQEDPALVTCASTPRASDTAMEPAVRSTMVGPVVPLPPGTTAAAALAAAAARGDIIMRRVCDAAEGVSMMTPFAATAAVGVQKQEMTPAADQLVAAGHNTTGGGALLAAGHPLDPLHAVPPGPALMASARLANRTAASDGGAAVGAFIAGLPPKPAAAAGGTAAVPLLWGPQWRRGGTDLSGGSYGFDIGITGTGTMTGPGVDSSGCNIQLERQTTPPHEAGGLRQVHALVGTLEDPTAAGSATSGLTGLVAAPAAAAALDDVRPRGPAASQTAAGPGGRTSTDAIGICSTSPPGPAAQQFGSCRRPVAVGSTAGHNGGVGAAAKKPLRAIVHRVRSYLRSGASSSVTDDPHCHACSTSAASPFGSPPGGTVCASVGQHYGGIAAGRRHSAAGTPLGARTSVGVFHQHRDKTAGGPATQESSSTQQSLAMGSPTLSECGGTCTTALRDLPCAVSPTGAPAMSPTDLSRAPHVRRPADVEGAATLLSTLSSGTSIRC